MAQSRLEKIGTIYTRTRGLIQSGALNYNDRPLWYDIYEAFPPKEEPRYDRPANKVPIKEIFYKEDNIRAELHKKVKTVGMVHLQNTFTPSFTQRFIETYKKLETHYAESKSEPENLFSEALDMLKAEREANVKEWKAQEPLEEQDTFTGAFKLASTESHEPKNLNIRVKDIFKD